MEKEVIKGKIVQEEYILTYPSREHHRIELSSYYEQVGIKMLEL